MHTSNPSLEVGFWEKGRESLRGEREGELPAAARVEREHGRVREERERAGGVLPTWEREWGEVWGPRVRERSPFDSKFNYFLFRISFFNPINF
jgi:hypothetical protein